MARRKKCHEKKKLFPKGAAHPNYRIRYGYTPVFNRSKKPAEKKKWVNRPCKRYTDEELKSIVKPFLSNSLAIPGADGQQGNAIILRPIKTHKDPEPVQSTSRSYDMDTGNMLVEKSRMLSLINESLLEHAAGEYCDSFEFDLVDMKPWGAFVSVVLVCKNCTYKSKRTKLYEEAQPSGKPGRRAAVGNMRLQLTLQDTPIFNTDAQLILASTGVRPGSLRGMQRLSHRAAEITEKVGEDDLVKQRNEVVEVLKKRGVEQPANMKALVSGCFDVRYSGVFKRSYCTPGPGASQAAGFFCENLTSKQRILGFDFVNQQCPKGSRQKGNGQVVICGRGDESHSGCTATQPRESCISEKQMARRIAKNLYGDSKIAVTHLTCDGDASGKIGFEQANDRTTKKLHIEAKERKKENSKWTNKSTKNSTERNDEHFLETMPPLTRFRDPVHVTWNILKEVQSYKFSETAFGLKENGDQWNYKEREECKKVFAMDISSRVSITVRNIRYYCDADVKRMETTAESTQKYLLACYNGDHTSFRRSPIAQLTACYGVNNCWIHRSETLRAQGVTHFSFSKTDLEFLKKAVSKKLSRDNIELVGKGSSSSRAEGVMRAYTKSVPKNRNAPRVALGRTHSVIGRVNNGLLEFSKQKFDAAGCSLPEGSEPLKVFERYQKRKTQVAESRKTQQSKSRRSVLQAERQKSYAQARRKISNEDEYRKHQLDNAEIALEEASTSFPNSSEASKASSHLKKVKKYADKQKNRKDKSKKRASARRSQAHLAIQKAKRKVNRALQKNPQVADHTYSRARPGEFFHSHFIVILLNLYPFHAIQINYTRYTIHLFTSFKNTRRSPSMPHTAPLLVAGPPCTVKEFVLRHYVINVYTGLIVT